MKQLVVGLGETGGPLFDILYATFGKSVVGYDLEKQPKKPKGKVNVLHICIPYLHNFIEVVKEYQKTYKPSYTIIF